MESGRPRTSVDEMIEQRNAKILRVNEMAQALSKLEKGEGETEDENDGLDENEGENKLLNTTLISVV